MLLYKTTYQIQYEKDEPEKTHSRWDGSAKDAGSNRKKIRQMHGFIPNSVQSAKIIVPTDKPSMLAFLNSNYFNNTI